MKHLPHTVFLMRHHHHGIIQEFTLGIDSHVRITLWCKFCSWGVWGMYLKSSSPNFAIYIYILLTTRSTFSVLNFKLRMQTNYPLVWMFLFHILASAFPTSYHMKTVCSCWVWKLSYDTCPLNVVLSASFLLQSDWLEKKAN